MTMTSAVAHAVSQLKVWEKVEIVVGEGDQVGHYLARVQDFINGGIVITEPEFLHGNSLLTEHAAVQVIITRDDAIYQFNSSVRRVMSRSKQQYLISPPRRIDRVQRRQFVRVSLTKRMNWTQVKTLADWQSFEDRVTWLPTTTVDISGGGVLFKVPDLVERQTRLLCKISLLPEIGLPETVAAVCMRGFAKGNQYYCGAAFILAEQLRRFFTADELKVLPEACTHFDLNGQNRLVSHIFQLQVAMRRKGLL